ncbi:hypothetical protein JCM8547_001674 [Rhodosporidiobolus lusitaniae]
MSSSPISLLPPELLSHILSLAVEGLPPTLLLRSTLLRSFALVSPLWTVPAQTLLETHVHLDSYGRARAFLERPRPLERPLVLEELVLFYDVSTPQDKEDFYPLTDGMTRAVCGMECEIRGLHLRSALLLDAFDGRLLALPAYRGLKRLQLDLPLDLPTSLSLPFSLTHLSLSTVMDIPTPILRTLLSNSSSSLISLHLFVLPNGAPLDVHLLEVLPSLPSTLRHLSLTSTWAFLPSTLLRFLASCTSLSSLSLTNILLPQLQHILSTLPSVLQSLDFTLPSSPSPSLDIPSIADTDVPSFIEDELLNSLPSLSRCRAVSVVRRVQNGGARSSWLVPRTTKGEEGMCWCKYEVTARRPLP